MKKVIMIVLYPVFFVVYPLGIQLLSTGDNSKVKADL